MSIEVLNESGAPIDERDLVETARHVLDRMGVSPLAELAISVQDAVEMERLHLQYMDEPGPTDVLAFPIDELDLRGSRGVPQGSLGEDDDAVPTVLGDVVLCVEVAERQAAQAGHSTLEELRLLTTHGVLHLLGFDHATAQDHDEMFGLQAELLAGLPSAGRQLGDPPAEQPEPGPARGGDSQGRDGP